MSTKTRRMVIFSSPDGKAWSPVMPQDTPEWVKNPDTLGTMIDGNMVQHNDGGPWYSAEVQLTVWERRLKEERAMERENQAARELLFLPADRAVVIESVEVRH